MKHLKRLLEQIQQLKSPIFVENSQIGQTSLDIAILGNSQEQLQTLTPALSAAIVRVDLPSLVRPAHTD